MSKRERFEKWALERRLKLEREPSATNIYWDPFTQSAFEGWQAGLEQASERIAMISAAMAMDDPGRIAVKVVYDSICRMAKEV